MGKLLMGGILVGGLFAGGSDGGPAPAVNAANIIKQEETRKIQQQFISGIEDDEDEWGVKRKSNH